MRATNFHLFLDALQYFLGGEIVQRVLVEKQLEVAIDSLTFENIIARELKKMCDINKMLGKSPPPYSEYFWRVYETESSKLIDTFKADMDHGALQAAMSQLIEYDQLIRQLQCEEIEHRKVIDAMESLVRLQMAMLMKHAGKFDDWVHNVGLVHSYDWTDETNCWRLNFPKCAQCIDGVTCPNSYHSALHPVMIGSKEADWEFNTTSRFWVLRTNGTSHHGTTHNDKTKPPADCPHHWVMEDNDKWVNSFTAAVFHGSHNPAIGKPTWNTLSPHDFCAITESILLLSHSKTFSEYFGREKVALEGLVNESKYGLLCNSGSLISNFLQGKYDDNGDFIPKYPDERKIVARIAIPRRLADPAHWGHLAWQLCQFVDSR
jgi:hypothetical protein